MDTALLFPDEIRLGVSSSGFHRLVADIPEETDIIGNAALHDEIVLEYHAEFATQLSRINRTDIPAVDQNATGIRVIQAHQQVEDRGLATAGGAKDAQSLALF